LVDMEGFPLGHVEASANRNEKMLVEQLLDDVLGEEFEVELVAGDSQFESERVFHLLEQEKVGRLISWRRLKGRVNPADVLTVKDRILVHLHVLTITQKIKSTTKKLSIENPKN